MGGGGVPSVDSCLSALSKTNHTGPAQLDESPRVMAACEGAAAAARVMATISVMALTWQRAAAERNCPQTHCCFSPSGFMCVVYVVLAQFELYLLNLFISATPVFTFNSIF